MRAAGTCQVLSAGLPARPADIAELRRRTGGWPVLLALANGALAEHVRRGLSVTDAGRRVAGTLDAVGPARLDVADATARDRAVSLTIEASLGLLAETGRLDRYQELAVRGEYVGMGNRWLPRLGNGCRMHDNRDSDVGPSCSTLATAADDATDAARRGTRSAQSGFTVTNTAVAGT
jgi:hypothetical protein